MVQVFPFMKPVYIDWSRWLYFKCPNLNKSLQGIQRNRKTVAQPNQTKSLETDPKEKNVYKLPDLKKIHALLFIATLFTVAKRWKQPECPLTNGWINKM